MFRSLRALVHPHRNPDATFLFDLDPAVALDRQRAQSRTPDKFEREAEQFFKRVREAYLAMRPRRTRPGSRGRRVGTMEEVRGRLAAAFAKAFP